MLCAISLWYRRTLPPEVGRQTERLRTRRELVDAPREVVQPGVQDGPLGLGVGGDLVQPLAQARLDLVGAVLERLEGLVALPLEPRPEPGEPLLDALRRCVADLVHALGQHPLGLAGEPLDRQVELAAQPPRSLLSGRADRRLELLRGTF